MILKRPPLSLLPLGLFVLLSQQHLAEAGPIVVDENSEASALYYLQSFGYVTPSENENTAQLLSADGVRKHIEEFQRFANITVTGKLDEATIELMNTPRCGNPDIVGFGATARKRRRRKKRYTLQGSRWRTKVLTYRITKYPSNDLRESDVDEQIVKAFDLWEKVTNLKFERKASGSIHIEIRFERREHGDGDPFDGPGGTLAHAYFPQYGGDAHFDDQELWTIDSYRGTNLLQTAAHEFGHSLGLSHSDVRSALMAPFYRGWEPNLKLDRDDVEAIQALYGPKETQAPTTTARPSTGGGGNGGGNNGNGGGNNGGDLCDDGTFDTIFGTIDGTFYVFKGSQYWKLTEDSVASGYPRDIGRDWPGLPDDVDAAVTWPNNKATYFFKGSQYWKFINQEPEPGYPKSIRKGFKGIPDNLDAAFIWGGNGKMYFFKGEKFWKFDPTRKPAVKDSYPRPITNWSGQFRRIDGAVKWSNKYTYFFEGDEYYRYNDRRFTVDRGEPSFPRKNGQWWFGCGSNGGFNTAGAEKEDAFVSLFDEEGDELLDVPAGDED